MISAREVMEEMTEIKAQISVSLTEVMGKGDRNKGSNFCQHHSGHFK